MKAWVELGSVTNHQVQKAWVKLSDKIIECKEYRDEYEDENER